MSNDEARTVRFPAERAVGWVSIDGERGAEPRPAQGDVTVAIGRATLTIPSAEEAGDLPGFRPGDLGALADLEPEALAGLGAHDVAEGALAAVGHLTGLRRLRITGDVSDDDLASVGRLSNLINLQIQTDDHDLGGGLAHLAQCSELQNLVLVCRQIEPEGLAALQPLERVTALTLSGGLGPAHLEALPAFPQLALLMLAGPMDADALCALGARVPWLQELYCEIAPDGVRAVREALPQTTINGSWLAPEAVARLGAGVAPLGAHDAGPDEVQPVELSEETWDEAIASDTPVLVDFWAEWCGPCRGLAPTIDALASKLAGQVVVGKLDIESNRGISERYNIMGIPALLVFRRGELVAKLGERSTEGLLKELAAVLG